MRRNSYLELLPKYFWAIFTLGIFSIFPILAHAQDNGVVLTSSSNSAFFTPAAADQSILYLGELFGSVPPVLAGTGSSLMGNLFKLFNTAILALGMLFAGYTTFVGILNTAGDGEMLGKGWSSIWVPIKTVAGIALLIPTGSGYCVIQVFMMWLLVQGIGAADTLTGAIVDYMKSGQQVFVAGSTGGASGENDNTKYDTTVKTIYQGLSCMQSYQKDNPTVNPTFVTPPTATVSGSTAVYDFLVCRSNTGSLGDSFCGANASSISCGQITITQKNTEALGFLVQGVNAIMPSLNSAAYFMVNDPIIPKDHPNDPPLTNPPYQSSINSYTAAEDTYNFVGADFINEVENTYGSYVVQANNAFGSTAEGNGSFYDDINSYGWVTLGNLYWDMAASAGKSETGAESSSKLTWNSQTNITTPPSTDGKYNPTDYYSQNAITYGNNWATDFIDDLITTRTSEGNGTSGDGFEASTHKDYIGVATDMMGALTMGTLNAMLIKFKDGRNPMIVAQEMGHEITIGTEAAITTLAVLMTGAAVWAGYYSSINPGFLVLQTIMAFILPGFMLFSGMLLVLGGTLSVIIPFIPALAYFLAVTAWMIATLETVIAAPIVAIGILHPDGHPVWGKAEGSIMLMTSMFLRPSLIVMGMAAGVILSFISVQFINFGYQTAMLKILGNTEPTSMEAILYLTTYVGLILACVNKSFSTIEVIPEQVMRWIQGGEAAKFGGGQDAMQKMQGAQEGQGSKTGEGTGHGAQESGQAGEKTAGKADKQAERSKANRERDKELQALGGSGNRFD